MFALSREELGFVGDSVSPDDAFFNNNNNNNNNNNDDHLLTFDWDLGSTMEVCGLMTDWEEGRLQFFDPLLGQCYNVTCGLLYENVAGDCRYRNITKEQFGLNNKSPLRPFEDTVEAVEECFMVTLQPWELRKETIVSISH